MMKRRRHPAPLPFLSREILAGYEYSQPNGFVELPTRCRGIVGAVGLAPPGDGTALQQKTDFRRCRIT